MLFLRLLVLNNNFQSLILFFSINLAKRKLMRQLSIKKLLRDLLKLTQK